MDGREVDLADVVAICARACGVRRWYRDIRSATGARDDCTGRVDVRVIESERRLRLVDGYLAGYLGDVAVEGPADEVIVAEDERLLKLEADSDDISGVPLRELVRLLDLEFVLEQELLIICQLHDQRNVEHVLQPPSRTSP